MSQSLNRGRLFVCFGIILALEVATIVAFCGQLFGCGCTLATGLTHCNIHTGEGPTCPWCSHGWIGFYLPFAVILAGSGLSTAWGLKWTGNSRLWGLLGGLAGYLVWGTLAALATAAYHDYPHVFGWTLNF